MPVINPGDCFGKCWLLIVEELKLIVEAKSVTDAFDELADSQEYGHLIAVEPENLGDYPEESRYSGQVIDLDHVMIYREEDAEYRYYGDGLPEEGIDSLAFNAWQDEQP